MTTREEQSTPRAAELRQAFAEIWNQHMTDFEMKQTELFIELQREGKTYFLPFCKQSIKTDFCFGYDTDYTGHECSDAIRRMENFRKSGTAFKNRNLEGIEEAIANLKDESRQVYLYISHINGGRIVHYTTIERSGWRTIDDLIMKGTPRWEATETERKQIIKTLQAQREKFGKRLDAYLKKYGTSKLHTWTYWRDE